MLIDIACVRIIYIITCVTYTRTRHIYIVSLLHALNDHRLENMRRSFENYQCININTYSRKNSIDSFLKFDQLQLNV